MSQCSSFPLSAAAAADGASSPFPGPLGSFVRRQWERSGLLPIAARVVSDEQLAEEEFQQLASAELPLLAKLVEHKRGGIRRSPAGAPCMNPPSGAAGKGIVEADHPAAAHAAMKRASHVVCRQELRSEPEWRPGLPPRFLQELRRWDAWCRSVDVRRTWTLVLPSPLETGLADDSQPLGEEALRAIAVAALILPHEVGIRAAVPDLGIKTAQVALEFGATCLGLPDGGRQTGEPAGMPPHEEVQRVLSLARPTPVDSSIPASARRTAAPKNHLPRTEQP